MLGTLKHSCLAFDSLPIDLGAELGGFIFQTDLGPSVYERLYQSVVCT